MLTSVQMFSEPSTTDVAQVFPPGCRVAKAIEQLYSCSKAEAFGISPDPFGEIVAAVLLRYAADAAEAEQLEILASLHIEELILARACSSGNEAAWEAFIARFRAPLFATAMRLTCDPASATDLTDSLNAELYGMPNNHGHRTSRLDYYMGRGSLEGWLRTVLARQHIDRCRSRSREVSLEEQIESGVAFAAATQTPAQESDRQVSSAIAQILTGLDDEERFLLANYFLDQRTLADIARMTGVHESTISRKLDKLTATLKKRIKNQLVADGMNHAKVIEILKDIDIRDLNVDVAASLKQATF